MTSVGESVQDQGPCVTKSKPTLKASHRVNSDKVSKA